VLFSRRQHRAAEAQFEAVFTAHAAFVWRTLRRFGVPPAELDDACQEVFIVVHRRLGEFEGRSQLRTWLYEIARRTALSTRRARRRTEHEPLETQAEPHDEVAPTPLERAEDREALAWLEATLATLDDDKREAFVLHELEDLTLADAARALGAPLNTVHARVQAAWRTIDTRARQRFGPRYEARGALAAYKGGAP
jgi:RNA polymerase sigma-70 factor, ECF subfamily